MEDLLNDQGLLFVDYIQAGEITEEVHNKCTENRKNREGMDSVQCSFTQHIRYYWFVKVKQSPLYTTWFKDILDKIICRYLCQIITPSICSSM